MQTPYHGPTELTGEEKQCTNISTISNLCEQIFYLKKKDFNFILTCRNVNQENNKLRILCYRMLAIPILDTS